MWNEPSVGALFGEFYYERFAHRRDSRGFFMGDRRESVWLRGIRSMVIEGAASRYDVDPAGHLVVKEPHGTVGAPLLTKAIPESRLVLLVRDPRDKLSSAFRAHSSGGWARRYKRGHDTTSPAADRRPRPASFAEGGARTYIWELHQVSEAYAAHEAPKALVRYEDLRRDPLEGMRHLCAALEVDVDEAELERTVEAQAWEAVPDDRKGELNRFRKATPGSWRDDLSPEQQEAVQEVARPILDTFYPGWEQDDAPPPPSAAAPLEFASLETALPPLRRLHYYGGKRSDSS
jgi:Sulfotransferase domain